MNSQPKLITIAQAANLLNVHPNTLRQWDESGELKAIRVGQRRDRRYRYSDILNLVNGTDSDQTPEQNKSNLLYNKQLAQDLQNMYLSVLEFLTPLSLEQTYKNIVKEAIKVTNGKYGSIFLPDNDNYIRIYTNNPKLYEVIPRKDGIINQSFHSKEPFITQQDKKLNPKLNQIDADVVISIPLIYEQHSIGVLTVLTEKENPQTEFTLPILKIFGLMSSLAIIKGQQYQELKENLELRDLFISLTSHEIKTPLTAIKTYAQLIDRKVNKQETPQPKLSQRLLGEINRFDRLLQDFFVNSRESHPDLEYHITECSLVEQIKTSINNAKITYPGYKYKFDNQLKKNPALIKADCDKILQVFTNIITNAAKYSPKKSIIQTSISQQGQFYTITIQDQGQGISPEELPLLFNKFYKGKQNPTGMGLGLYLTKSIIDKHDGTIEIQSKVNQGTRVIIKLPSKK